MVQGIASSVKPKETAEKTILRQILRAAAYCRVSTLAEEQEGSYELQMRAFEEKILSDPNLTLVKLYGDRGTSDGNAEKRIQFQEMIQDCSDGQIDIIFTKSISRFARNVAEYQKYVRELKNRHVEVRFEREGISSMDPSADFIFSVLAITVQEENPSISENVRWTYRKNFEQGIYHMGNHRIFGYDMWQDRKLTPNEDA